MTPDQLARMKAHARKLLAERDAGAKCSREGLDWAEWVLKVPDAAAEVPFDDELPEHMRPEKRA